MFRVTLAAALVSIVSGCVTSDPGPLSSQVTKPRQSKTSRRRKRRPGPPGPPVQSPGLKLFWVRRTEMICLAFRKRPATELTGWRRTNLRSVLLIQIRRYLPPPPDGRLRASA